MLLRVHRIIRKSFGGKHGYRIGYFYYYKTAVDSRLFRNRSIVLGTCIVYEVLARCKRSSNSLAV